MNKIPFNSEWVAAAKDGDSNAITLLYNHSYQNVYLTIKSMHRFDEDTVLDLTQDTFLKAFDRLDQLDDPSRFNAWVKQIGRNTALDYLKKSKALLFSELSGSNEDDSYFEAEDTDTYNLPDVVIDRAETARLIQEILDALPEGQRVAVSMFYYQGMSVKEIAVALGRSEGTIKAQLSNGRKAIEKKVRELEKNEGVKLYSLAPLPFLLLLLHNADAAELVAPSAAGLEQLLQAKAISAQGSATSVSNAAPKTAANSAAKAAGGTAAKAAGSAAAKGLATKIVAGVLAVTLLGGGAAVGINVYRNMHMPPEETVENLPVVNEDENEPKSSEETTPSDLSVTTLSLADYIAFTYEGENGSGTVHVTLDSARLAADAVEAGVSITADELEASFSYTLSQSVNLSNGELITVAVSVYGKEDTLRDTVYGLAESVEVYDYDTLITEYKSIINGTLSIDDAGIDLSESGLGLSPSAAYGRIDDDGYFIITEDSQSFFYTACDLNGDQVDELIIME